MSTAGPTGNKVFAPAIFFIAFREALEASLVIGILSGMLERVVDVRNGDQKGRALVKRLRRYIFFGALTGLSIAFAIGAAFLAVFYTQTTDLYGRSEELWEGIFNMVAVLLITPMSLAILRADRSRAKWRKKLAKAFAGLHSSSLQDEPATSTNQATTATERASHSTTDGDEQPAAVPSTGSDDAIAVVGQTTPELAEKKGDAHLHTKEDVESPGSERVMPILEGGRVDTTTKTRLAALWTMVKRPFSGEARGATAIFVIPLITTLREGLEGVVFIGGVSLGLPATSIPLPAVLGLFCGLLCGFIVFKAGSFSKVRFFLVFSTCFLLVIAAGMFSRSVYYLQFYRYVQLVGDGAAESGSGPGSYNALDYVWHLDCCNPEDKTNGGGGWAILNSIFGWNNTATTGSLLSYIFYWLAVSGYLVYSHVRERRAAADMAKRRAVAASPAAPTTSDKSSETIEKPAAAEPLPIKA